MTTGVPTSSPEPGSTTRRWHDLGTRAASGLVLIVLAIATAKVGGIAFMVVWIAAAAAMNWEWQRLVGGPWIAARVIVGCLAMLVLAIAARRDLETAVAVLLALAGAQLALGGRDRRIWAAAGALYAGLPLIAVLVLRFSYPFGSRSIIWLFATVWSTDVFAYFGGRLIGGAKLWPRVSPSKTWSGTVSGIAAGAAIGTFVALRDLPGPTSAVLVFLLTVATAALSQGGDMVESAIKRRFGVKDSSRVIPGHGGVMDRLDGFGAAAVFAALFGLARDLPSAALGLFYWA